MNAIDPRPKRLPGTGTVAQYGGFKGPRRWKIRLPGARGREYGGFVTYEAAENALERAMRGHLMPRVKRRRKSRSDLRAMIRRCREYAAELGLRIEDVLSEMTSEQSNEGGTT